MALTNNDYNALPQLANIQGFWRMEEESGNRADLSDNANTLQDNATVLFGIGKIGNAADFEADNHESLLITNALQTGLDITGDLTISVWVKPETISGDRTIMGKWKTGQRSYLLRITANKIEFFVSNDGSAYHNIVGGTDVGTELVHIIATHNTTTDLIEIFYNNVSDATPVAHSTGIYNSTALFGIGTYEDEVSWYDGLQDEAIIWGAYLTADERTTVYNIQTLAAYHLGGSFLHNMMR